MWKIKINQNKKWYFFQEILDHLLFITKKESKKQVSHKKNEFILLYQVKNNDNRSPKRFFGQGISHLVPTNPGGQVHDPVTESQIPPLKHWHISWQFAPKRPWTHPKSINYWTEIFVDLFLISCSIWFVVVDFLK